MPFFIVIPEYEEDDEERYPGDIKPGVYELNEIAELMREHSDDPRVILFLAAMLEE